MPTTIEKYVAGCKEIVDAKPAYKNGASSLTECDCIGMDFKCEPPVGRSVKLPFS